MSTEPQAASVSEVQNSGKTAPVGEDCFADFNFESLETSLEAMMKSGVHFGHQKSRRNPKMKEFIFTTRKGVDILDLQKTVGKIERAVEFLKSVKKSGKKILFVGTKKQSSDVIKASAQRLKMPYVVDRWLGGTFTNFKNIRGRVNYLIDSEKKMEAGEFSRYTKFERLKKSEELEKMEGKMGGIKEMTEFPGVLFAVDIKSDELAISEAKKVGIPVVALADTNIDPTLVDYPIPANDDAVSSLKFILGYICKELGKVEEEKK